MPTRTSQTKATNDDKDFFEWARGGGQPKRRSFWQRNFSEDLRCHLQLLEASHRREVLEKRCTAWQKHALEAWMLQLKKAEKTSPSHAGKGADPKGDKQSPYRFVECRHNRSGTIQLWHHAPTGIERRQSW
eukprot:2155525-Amphidinium_carterae.1